MDEQGNEDLSQCVFLFHFFSFQSGLNPELFDGSVVVSAHSLIFLLSSDLQGIERQKARVDGEKERERESHQSVLMLCCVGFGLFTVKLHSWVVVCVVLCGFHLKRAKEKRAKQDGRGKRGCRSDTGVKQSGKEDEENGEKKENSKKRTKSVSELMNTLF
jgi:hypothetical protein